jgi:Flp pilus assembly secretin CpaC
MHWHRSVAFTLGAALVTFSLAAPAGAIEHIVSLSVGSSHVVPAPGIMRVAVGDGTVAGVVPAGDELIINGKSPGRTTVAIWMRDGSREQYEVVVTDSGIDTIEQMIRQALDLTTVSVSQAGGAVLVRGTVPDATQMAHITDVLSRFDAYAKAKSISIINVVSVTNPLGEVRNVLARDPLTSRVRVDGDGKGNVVVSGSVYDRANAELVLSRVRSLAGPYLSADGKIIDRLATETTTQIAIKVNVLEIDRTGLSQLGIELQGATPDPTNPGVFTIGDPNFITIEGAGSGNSGRALTVAPFFRLTRLAPTINLLEQTGHARELSSPDLVTSPGQEASFLVGGQVPYAVSTGLGQTSIVFKDYGVKLDMTPTLLGDGTIETKISPEISDLDFSNGITLNGFVVPALKTSRLSTDVVTRDGDAVVMGGLLRRLEQKNIQKIPLLGDLPILGKLFRSTQYQLTDTDVIFVMTPDVVVR